MLRHMKKILKRMSLTASVVGLCLLASKAFSEALIQQKELSQLIHMQNILGKNQAFVSDGHEKSLVKVYANEMALQTYRDYEPGRDLEFPEGSFIIKAFVSSEKQDPLQSSRLLVMKKVPGSDPQNHDWAYASFVRAANQADFEAILAGRPSDCIRCHQAYQAWDYVLTIDRYYKDQNFLSRFWRKISSGESF